MTKKLVALYHKVLTPPYTQKDFMILGVTVLVVIGLPLFVYMAEQEVELRSHASETLLTEPENGTLAGDVVAVENPNASGGKYIRLGTYVAPTATPTPSTPQLYVAPNGSGTSCTQVAPCSLTTANTQATPGTTVIAAAGTYNGNFITTKGGTAGNLIMFRSEVKHGAIISGNNGTSNQSAVEIKHPYIRFQDFTITGTTSSKVRNGVLINADNVEIIGNHIYNICQFLTGGTSWQGGAGIDIWSDNGATRTNILIDGNHIHHVGAPGSTQQLVHGMYLGVHVSNGRVTNNVIYRVEDFGLHPYDQTEASGWQFINNTVANTGRGILQAPNGVTRNNIVYNTRGASYDIRGTGNVLSNNIAGGTGSSGSVSGVTYGVNPLFVNASSDDYRLQSSSPAIDAATSQQAPTTDFDGKTRPQGAGFDIGAFEYSSTN